MALLSLAFKRVCLLALMLLVFTNEVHGQTKVFNVKDFGAIPDGKTDNSEALVSAWSKACEFKGDATVLIPLGNFRASPVILKGPCNYKVMVELDGVLMAPSDPLLDSGHWITFEGINGLTVHGSGSFDGQGSSAWSHIKNCGVDSDCKSRPVSVGFESITNGLVQGITSLNSKYFHFTINNCNTMAINNLKITAPGDSPNTDGIHVARSANIHISDTKISTGDDCISLGPGSTNISIWGILCGPGHGISIGSLGKAQGEENVSGINVRNCNISNTENGLRIKTWAPSPPSSVYDVTFEGITLNNANNPIIIDQRYCPYKYCSHQGDSRVQISNVKFIDISGSSSTKLAVNLQCSRSAPCKDIELDGIDIHYNGKGAIATSFCSNAAVSFQGQQIPPPCA